MGCLNTREKEERKKEITTKKQTITTKGEGEEKDKMNKKINLFISQNLKKITSLSTILQLRDI